VGLDIQASHAMSLDCALGRCSSNETASLVSTGLAACGLSGPRDVELAVSDLNAPTLLGFEARGFEPATRELDSRHEWPTIHQS
jgi:predicted small lipoprotein YifL